MIIKNQALRERIPEAVLIVRQTLEDSGYKSFIVGGSIRDLLLGKSPKDYDITTSATLEEVRAIFGRVIDTGIRFGTVTVIVDNIKVEVTTFRQLIEAQVEGSRASQTEGKAIGQGSKDRDGVKTDVSLRDFTINGLLYDGEGITDYVGGLKDLQDKLIRATGQPQARFREDPLRMLRAVRFACQLGFRLEPQTYEAIGSDSNLIGLVAPERIREEFVRIILSPEPAQGFRKLRDTGLLNSFLPELEACVGFDQNTPYHDKDVFEHSLAVVEHTSENIVVRLAALLHDIGKPRTYSMDEKGMGHFYAHNVIGEDIARVILHRLRFDRKTGEKVSMLVREHMNRFKVVREASLKKLIGRVGPENLEYLFDLQRADILGMAKQEDLVLVAEMRQRAQEIIKNKQPLTVHQLAINGSDLLKSGFAEGREIGLVLKQLLDHELEVPQDNSKEKLIELAFEIRQKKK